MLLISFYTSASSSIPPPLEVVCDNGGEFVGPEFRNLLKAYKIKLSFITPRHPQANGMTERDNHTISECVRKLVDEGHSDWDAYVPKVVYALNTAVHEMTGFSPFFLLHGFEAHCQHFLPTDEPLQPHESTDIAQAALVRKIALEAAAERTADAQAAAKKRYDEKRRTDLSKFMPGCKVWVEKCTTIKGLSQAPEQPIRWTECTRWTR